MSLVSTIRSRVKLKEKPISYSHSKIKSFTRCSTYYHLTYIEKILAYKDTNSTVLGTFLHSALEYLYDDHNDDDINFLIDAFEKTSIKEINKLGITEADKFIELLLELYKDIDHLYYLASEDCTGSECIRTQAGKIAKSPQMTSGWKKKEKELRIDERKKQINSAFENSVNEKYQHLDIVEIYSTARRISKKYRTAREIEEIIALELPISKWDKEENILINPVRLCINEEENIKVFATGYIDLVCKVKIEGEIYTAIIDHKSSKESFNTESVQYNQQLNLYVELYEQLTGEPVHYIGINSLRDNQLVLAPVDIRIKNEIVDNFKNTISHTYTTKPIKYFPEGQYSLCLNMYNKPCPFLENCHQEFYEKAKLMNIL